MSLTVEDLEIIQQLLAENNIILLAEFDKMLKEKFDERLRG